MTVHVVLEKPESQRFEQSLARNDHVIDLTRSRAIGRLEGHSVSVFRASLEAAGTFERAKTAFLDWHVEVGQKSFSGKSLAEWLRYDERLSLWWTTGLSVKSVHQDIWRAFLFLHWLEDLGENDDIPRLLSGSKERFLVWTHKARLAAFARSALARYRGIPVAQIDVCSVESDTTWSTVRRRLERWARLGVELLAGQLFWFQNRLGSIGKKDSVDEPDILVPTVPTSWYEDSGGSLRNRYLRGVPERLRERDISVAFLPACPGGRAMQFFFRQYSDARDVFRWELLDTSAMFLPRVLLKHQRVRRHVRPLLRELCDGRGIQYRGLDVTQWFVDAIHSTTINVGFQNAYLYEMMRQAFEAISPSLILYKDEFYSSGRAISAARPAGIQGWAFQHGTVSRDHLVYVNDVDWLAEEPSFRSLPTPDLFLCYGDFAREIVTERGYPRERVVALGSLRHDRVYRHVREHSVSKSELDLPEGSPVLTLCAQRRHDSEDWLRLLVRGVQRLGLDCHIVVKPHPRFAFEDAAKAIFDELGWTAYTTFHDRLNELLGASDVVLTGSSTTGLDAVLAGTPLITFVFDEEFERFPYAEDGVALKVVDLASMSRALERVLSPAYRSEWSQSKRTAFLRRHLSPSDGHAVDAFVEMLARQMRSADLTEIAHPDRSYSSS